MIHRSLNIGRWNIDFLFAPKGYDIEETLTYLYFADASDDVLVSAFHIMESEENNTGFTFTNQLSKTAVVVVGPSDDGDEFINTLCHEMYHLAVAIAEGLNLDLSDESPAYILGDSIQQLTEAICKLGCSKCNS